MKNERTPFILLILKLPFWIIKLILDIVGLLVCLPIYAYCLISNSFLFNPKFEANQKFYLAFCMPRALISTGTFAIGGGELYLFAWIINKFIMFHSKLEVIITLSSIIIFIGVSLKFGYRLLQSIFNFPKLRSLREYLVLILYGVQDIFSGALTIIVLLLGFRAMEVIRYKLVPNQRRYPRFIISKFFETLLDVICLPFWLVLGITIWRLFYTIREIQKTKSEGRRRFLVVYQAISALLDLLFIPLLLIALLNPFLKGRRLISHMNVLSIQSWRRLILEEFFSTLLDLVPFSSLILSLLSIYETPMAYTLYKAILNRTRPFMFDEHAEELGKLEEDSQVLADMNQKVHRHNVAYERKYRACCLMLVALILVDIITLTANILLMLSIYRKAILQRKVNAKRVEFMQSKEDKEDLIILTYSEYRRYVLNFMSLEQHDNKLLLFSYPLMIISESLYLLFDIPVIAVCPLFVIVPWRGLSVKTAIQKEWTALQNFKEKDYKSSIRTYILSEILMGLLDYVCILLFLCSLLGIWRSKEMYNELKTIIQSDISIIGSKHLIFAAHAADSVFDIAFIPLFLVALINPFLKGRRLIKEMKKTSASSWRMLVLEEFGETVLDLLPFLCIIMTFGTVFEIQVVLTLYKTILKLTEASSFNEKKEPLIDKKDKSQQERNNNEVDKFDVGYRDKCFALIPLILLDIVVILLYVILGASIYRVFILKEKIKVVQLKQMKNNSKVILILTYSDYRQALYDTIPKKLDLSEICSRLSEYFMMLLKEVFSLLVDIPVIMVSPILIIMPWRAKHVYDSAKNEWNNLSNIDNLYQKMDLRGFVLSEIIMGLMDFVCIPFFFLSTVIFWRSKDMYQKLRVVMESKSLFFSQFEFISDSLNCFIDILYIPLFMIALINPFLKAKRLLQYMSLLPVDTWRTLILTEFTNSIHDIVPFLFFMLSLISIYEIPVAVALYRAILKKTEPLNFDDEMQALFKTRPNHFLSRISPLHNYDEARYRVRCLGLPFLVLIDIVTLFLNILLGLSIYRYAILQRKVGRDKLVRLTNKNCKKQALTYSEFRVSLFEYVNLQSNGNLLSYQFMLFEEIISFLIDIPVIIMSVVLVLFPWRAKRVIQAAQDEWKKLGNIDHLYQVSSLRGYVLSEILMGLLDYVCFLFFIASLVSAWRFRQMYNALKIILESKLSDVEDKHLSFIGEAVKSLVDIFYIPPFLIAMCNPFLKGRRLIQHMRALPGHIWWQVVKDEFVSTILDIIPFLCGLLSCATLYEAPLAFSLYKEIIKQTTPFSFENLTEYQLKLKIHILYEMVTVHNARHEMRYRSRCLMLIPFAFLDILILIMNILLGITVYRYIILERKANTFIKLEEQKEHKIYTSAWTYNQYRSLAYRIMTLEPSNREKIVSLFCYPRRLVMELFHFLLDVPIMISCTVLILFPWRAKRLLNTLREEWRKLESIEYLQQKSSLRRYILSEILMGMIDCICILFFLLTSWIVWRSKTMWKDLVTITNSNLSNIKDRQIIFIRNSLNNVLDIIFIPPFLIALLNPFLKGRRLITHMKEMPVETWRRLIIDELESTMLDILFFLCLVLAALTLIESTIAFGLYKSILKQTEAFSFEDRRDDAAKLESDALYEKVRQHCKRDEGEYRIRCLVLLLLILMDAVVLIANVLLGLSIYRRLILNKKVATLSVEEMKKNEMKRRILTFSSYRKVVYETLVTDKEKSDRIFYYPVLILSEVFKLLLDIPIIVISLILVLFPWRCKHIYARVQKEWQKLGTLEGLQEQCNLRSYILSEILMGILDYICIVFFLASSMIIWRSKKMRGDLKIIMQSSLSDIGFKHFKFILKALDSLLDIIFIPPFLLALINPFLKGKRLFSHMSVLPVETWRRLILEEFWSTVIDIVPFGSLLLSVMTIYEIPIAVSLYKTVIQKTRPFVFAEKEEEKDSSMLLSKAILHNKIYENQCRIRCLMLIPLALLDAVVLIGNLLLCLSVYRYTILKAKASEILKNNVDKRKSFVAYASYREVIKSAFCDSFSLSPDLSMVLLYPELVLSELGELLLDLPIIILCPLFIIAPWRAHYAIEAAKKVWKSIEKNENGPDDISLRKYVLIELAKGALDYLCFIIFLVYLLAFWRYRFVFSEMKAIWNLDIELVKKSQGYKIQTRMDAFNEFCRSNIDIFIIDFICIPIVLPLLPFYLICTWRIKLLRKCLDILELKDFAAHRKIFIQIGLICAHDFLKIIPLLATYITVYRVRTLQRMILSVKAQELNKVESDSSKLKENEQRVNQEGKAATENNKLMTCNLIINQEKELMLLEAGIKCCILVILDIISFPLLVAIYIDYSYLDDYRSGIKSAKEKRESLNTIRGHYDNEGEIVYQKLYFGGLSVLDLIVKVCGLIMTILLMWRGPTLIILILKKNLKYQLYTIEKPKGQFKKKSELEKYGPVMLFCFKHFFIDLLYIPYLLTQIVLTPWRSFPIFKEAYKIDDTSPVNTQVNKQRALIVKQLTTGLEDIAAIFQFTTTVLTIIRMPFLAMVLLKNRFPNSKLSIAIFRRKEIINDNNRYVDPNTRLSLKKCISLSYRELVLDLDYISCTMLLIILAPWRLIDLYHMFISQLQMIPIRNSEVRALKRSSSRSQLSAALRSTFRCDYVNLFKIVVMILTLYKIPRLVNVLIHYVKNSRRYYSGEFSFSREIEKEARKGRSTPLHILFAIVILLCGFRVRNTRSRIRRYLQSVKKDKELNIKQDNNDQNRKENSLLGLEWNLYSQISQFLTPGDLARLSQVNKSLYAINQNDAYWQYQADRDLAAQRNLNDESSFKERCIRAAQEKKERRKDQPLSEQQLDMIYGLTYILFDETVKSLCSLPTLLLLPFKGLSYLIWCALGKNAEFLDFFRPKNDKFIDAAGLAIYKDHWKFRDMLPKFEEIQTFDKLHTALPGFVAVFCLRYICGLGNKLAYVGINMFKVTSAGEVSPMKVIVHPAPELVEVNFPKEKKDLAETSNKFLGFLLHTTQCVVLLIDTVLLAVITLAPGLITYYYANWTLSQAIFGPYCLFLVHYGAVFNAIITQLIYIRKGMPYFRPYRMFIDPLIFIEYLAKKTWPYIVRAAVKVYSILHKGVLLVVSWLKIVAGIIQNTALKIWKVLVRGTHYILSIFKITAKVLATAILFVWRSIVQVIRYLGKGIKSLALFIVKKCLSAGKGSYQGYIEVLMLVTKFTLKYGLVGDIILTPFALSWMLWPLVVAYFVPSRIYIIPCSLVSVVLVFIGYRKIQQVAKPYSQPPK